MLTTNIELKISQLRYVITIIDQGGYHAAAKVLHRSQPAISMAVKDLEDRLGQAIFEKNTGKATLTPFGKWCDARFRELLTHHDRISADAISIANHQQGFVALSTVPSVASRLMPKLLPGFLKQHPNISISLLDGHSEWVNEMLLKGDIELGITTLWTDDEALHFTPLMHDEIGVVCRSDHPLAKFKTVDWTDLRGYAMICNGTSRLLEGSAASELLRDSELFISNMISLTAILEEGIGITTLPKLAFPHEHNTLRFIPLTTPSLHRKIGLLKRAHQSLSPAAQAMYDYLDCHLKDISTLFPEKNVKAERS